MAVMLSVLVAAHNAGPYVHHAIASALAQTCRDIEVIAVDDGSIDATWNVILEAARRDARVVPVRHPQCLGPAAARNSAIRHAQGRWLAVLDADDLFLPERIERLVALAEDTDADLLADNLLERDFATGAMFGLCFSDAAMAFPEPLPAAEIVRRDMPDAPGRSKFGFLKPIIRREFLVRHGLRYHEDIGAGEDLLLYFECVMRGARFRLTPGSWYVYSLRQGSISTRLASSLHLSVVNRRMLRLAKQGNDSALLAPLLRRQRLIDSDCFGLVLQRDGVRAALRYARYAEFGRMLRHIRVVAGAARQRLTARTADGG